MLTIRKFCACFDAGVVKASSENGKATARNYAVVDTNAIIKGMRLEQLGTEAVTIQEARRALAMTAVFRKQSLRAAVAFKALLMVAARN